MIGPIVLPEDHGFTDHGDIATATSQAEMAALANDKDQIVYIPGSLVSLQQTTLVTRLSNWRKR